MTEAFEKLNIPLYQDGVACGYESVILSPRAASKLSQFHSVKVFKHKNGTYAYQVVKQKGDTVTSIGKVVLEIEGIPCHGKVTLKNTDHPRDYRPYNLRNGGEDITRSTPCSPESLSEAPIMNNKPYPNRKKNLLEDAPQSADEISEIELLKKLSGFCEYLKNVKLGNLTIEEIYFK
jgi:hypothetical protein